LNYQATLHCHHAVWKLKTEGKKKQNRIYFHIQRNPAFFCSMQTQKKTQNSDFDCTCRNKHNPTRHANMALITITINTRTVKASTVAQIETLSMCIANISDHAEQHINEISKHDIVSSK